MTGFPGPFGPRKTTASAELAGKILSVQPTRPAALPSDSCHEGRRTRRMWRELDLTYADLRGANLFHSATLIGVIWPPDAPVPVGWQRGDTGRLELNSRRTG